jgi:hypothetical protein
VTVIRWETPPPKRSGWHLQRNPRYVAIADELRGRPNQWALIMTDGKSGTVGAIKIGKLRAFGPKGSFEARGQLNDDKATYTVWARYVGEVAS